MESLTPVREILHRTNENPLADPGLLNPVAHSHDMSTTIGALDTGKVKGFARPSSIGLVDVVVALVASFIGGGGDGLGVPADAGVHIGVVSGTAFIVSGMRVIATL